MSMNFNSECTFCKGDPETCSRNKPNTNLLNVIVSVTERCNRNCPYCWHFERVKKRGTGLLPDMTNHDVDLLLDTLDRQFPQHQLTYVALGGEPSLKLDVMDYLLTETKRRRGTFFCYFITNGEDNLEGLYKFARKHKNVQITYSAPNDITLCSRTAELFVRMQEAINLRFSIVVEERNILELKDIFKFYKKLGVRKLLLNFEIHKENFNILDKEKYKAALWDALDYYINELFEFNFRLINLPNPTLDPKMAKELMARKPEPDASYSIDYFADNNFYASHFVNCKPIGNVVDGIDMNELNRMNTAEKCIDCKYTFLCSLNRALLINEDMTFAEDESICFPWKVIAEYFMKLYNVE